MAKLRIKEVLRQKKLTNYEFAKRLKTDPTNVTKMLRSTYNPTFTTLEKCAQALDVSIKDLIED